MLELTAGRSEPRARDADFTRDRLLRAAMRRFTLLGYDRTTTRDIAHDAGVNVSLIARYFGSKAGLFAVVLDQSAQAMVHEGTREVTDAADALLDGLRTGAWDEFGGEHPLLMLVNGTGESEEIAVLRARSLDAAVQRLGSLAGDPPADPSPRASAFTHRLRGETVLALLVGLLSIRAAIPNGALADSTRAQVEDLVRHLAAAVATTGA